MGFELVISLSRGLCRTEVGVSKLVGVRIEACMCCFHDCAETSTVTFFFFNATSEEIGGLLGQTLATL